jgi:hypothetical protein
MDGTVARPPPERETVAGGVGGVSLNLRRAGFFQMKKLSGGEGEK